MKLIASEEMPKRIRLSRKKGYRLPENAKKVDRSTRWGNPFGPQHSGVVFGHKGLPAPIVTLGGKPSLSRCLDLFTAYLYGRLRDDPAFLDPLKGKDLACWCPLDQPCHADILLRIANESGVGGGLPPKGGSRVARPAEGVKAA